MVAHHQGQMNVNELKQGQQAAAGGRGWQTKQKPVALAHPPHPVAVIQILRSLGRDGGGGGSSGIFGVGANSFCGGSGFGSSGRRRRRRLCRRRNASIPLSGAGDAERRDVEGEGVARDCKLADGVQVDDVAGGVAGGDDVGHVGAAVDGEQPHGLVQRAHALGWHRQAAHQPRPGQQLGLEAAGRHKVLLAQQVVALVGVHHHPHLGVGLQQQRQAAHVVHVRVRHCSKQASGPEGRASG